MVNQIEIGKYPNIIILTGAGISVASGIRPFRGPGGIWTDSDIDLFATKDALADNPFRVWKFFAQLRKQLLTATPNAAHYALAKLEQSLRSDQQFTLVTQNVDGLHQKAGSKNVIEIHGNINQTKCTNPDCQLKVFVDLDPRLDSNPICQLCGSALRMDIVLFGEGVATRRIKQMLRKCELFIAIGTSGVVFPAAGFANTAKFRGAKTILINLEDHDGAEMFFDERIIGKAEELLPSLFQL